MRYVVLMVLVVACQAAEKPAAPPPPPPAATIADLLAMEASSRPEGARRAEDVFAALRQAGLAPEDGRQYVARTVAARYCAGTRTAAGVAVAVCEYADDAAAREGRATMERRFPMAHRRILVHGRNTVTLTSAPGAEGEVGRVVATLEAIL